MNRDFQDIVVFPLMVSFLIILTVFTVVYFCVALAVGVP